MAYKAKIDNVVYDLKDGFTIKDELNETLDSAVVQFNTYNGEVPFECFDVSQIYDDSGKMTPKYFLVDTIDDEVRSFGSNFDSDDHLYTVNLFSETKELERITLPNCSVTQPMLEGMHRKTVWEEIERFCSLYIPRIKVYDSESPNNYSYQRKYTLDPLLRTRFQNIECPEFQWNNPTLREVLNDLVSTDDCIIIAKRGIISFYDLKEKGNQIDTSKLSLSKRTMTSQDYAGELTIDMQNAVGKSRTCICSGLTLRAPNGSGTLTTDNGVIPTMHPIYSIKKLIVSFPISYRNDYGDVVHYGASLDITDRVLEEEEFKLMSQVKVYGSAYNSLPTFRDKNGATLPKHKLNYLYFKRGSNNIFNVGIGYSSILGTSRFATDALNDIAIARRFRYEGNVLSGYKVGFNFDNVDPRVLTFSLEYETLMEHSMKVGKHLPAKHHENRIFDNQSNSYVDIDHQSTFEYSKINRLGHKVRTIYGEYQNELDIPQLGDFIGDEILFSREITYFDNVIMFKGYLTPHYVLKDFFTGVKAKKRSWQLAKSEDALTRHDVYKIYVETSFSNKIDDWSYSDADGIKELTISNLIYDIIPVDQSIWNDENLMVIIRTKDENNNYFPNEEQGIEIDSDFCVQGRSICCNFGFNDNYKSYDYVVKDGSETTQSFYAYANDYGEFDESCLVLYRESKGASSQYVYETSESDYLNFVNHAYGYPKINLPTSSGYGFVVNVKKDNREIIQHTLQFEFCSDNLDIITTDKFLSLCKYVYDGIHYASSLKLYLSNDTYDRSDKNVKGTLYNNIHARKLLVGNNIRILVTLTSESYRTNNPYPIPDGIKSWAITDVNNNLLLAVNIQEGQTAMEMYFNLLRSRDDKIYSNAYDGIPVGDITLNGIANASNRSLRRSSSSNEIKVLRRLINRGDTI